MKKLVKIMKEEIASQLISVGFNYLKEVCNGQTVFVFVSTPQLEEYLIKHYNNAEIIRSNILSFGRRTIE